MEEIRADTLIEQLLNKYPTLSKVFIDFGLPCLVCGEPFWGTVAELGSTHGISIDELVNKLNKVRAEID